jgi:beta-lactamase class A
MRPNRTARPQSHQKSSHRDRPGFWQFLFRRGKKGSAETRLQSETTLQPPQSASDRYADGLHLFQPGRVRASGASAPSAATRRPQPSKPQPGKPQPGKPQSGGSPLPFKRKPGSTQQRPSDRTRLERSPQDRHPDRTVLQTKTVLQPEAPTRLEGKVKQRRDRRPVNSAARRDRPQPPAPAKPARRLSRGEKVAVYLTRMVVLSVGIGVLAGTLLSVWDPATRATSTVPAAKSSPNSTAQAAAPVVRLPLGQELAPLKANVQTLITQSVAQNPQISPRAFLLDLDTNAYVDVNAATPIAAASTIKVPILVALLQEVDAGKVRLDEVLTMRKDLIGTGSGDMQWQPPGTQFTLLETIQNMIIVSDNTATNMVIARLGGIAGLNQRFKSWGLTATSMSNVLPDLEGTNLTTAKDMGLLLLRVSQGELLSPRSRDRMMAIMQKTANDSLLPRGLGEGATIAHKTGDIGTAIGDVGLIDLPSGKRYVAALFTKRAFNDDRASELLRQISRAAYQALSRPATSPPSALRANQELPRNPDGSVVNPANTAMSSESNSEAAEPRQ